MKHLLRIVLLALICVISIPASAQNKTIPAGERLDAVNKAVQTIAKPVKEEYLDDAVLLELRAKLDPLSAQTQAIIDELQPALDAARKRVEQLGPPPANGAPPETPDAAKQRAELQKAFEELDTLVKRARVVSLTIQQTIAGITNARRDLLLGEIFQQSSSALNPKLWYDGVSGLPGNFVSLKYVFEDWSDQVQRRLHGARAIRFAVFALALWLIYFLLHRISSNYLARRPQSGTPTAFEKVVSALWTALLVALLPIIFVTALAELLKLFELVPSRVEPFVAVILEAVRTLATSAGLARGLLAPGRPDWRLINLPDVIARRFYRLTILFVSIVVFFRIFEVIHTIIAAPLAVSLMYRVFGTTLAVAVLGRSLYSTANLAKQMDCEFGPRVDGQRDWFAIWRVAIWAAIICVLAANILGYVNFANFIVAQIIWITFVVVAGNLLRTLAHELIGKVMKPEAAFAIATSTALGVEASALKQVSILLEGVVTLLIYFATMMLILAPWGVESDSVLETAKAAFYGFSFGAINFSLSGVFVAIALFGLGFIATRAFQKWLDASYLPSTSLDAGLRNSITTSAGYIGIIAAITLPFAYLGFNFEKLAIVAGALSLGIGFGLQSIVSNFVSGLILLWERAIKVGDWIVVGTDQGIVRRINVRSTEIETFERQTVIVPNSSLITGVVKNWVRGDRSGRISVEVGVDYNSDPETIRDILLACAREHPCVAELPAPHVLFTAFGDSALNFELRCFVADVDNLGRTRSELRFEIFKRFKEAGVNIPFPQSDITVRNLDKLTEVFGRGGKESISISATPSPEPPPSPASPSPAPGSAAPVSAPTAEGPPNAPKTPGSSGL